MLLIKAWRACPGFRGMISAIRSNDMNPTTTRHPLRCVALLLALLVLIAGLLAGCKSSVTDSIFVQEPKTNMVAVMSPNSIFLTASNSPAINITNHFSVTVTNLPLQLPDQPISLVVTGLTLPTITNHIDVTAYLIATNFEGTGTNPGGTPPAPPEQNCHIMCKLLDILDNHYDSIMSGLSSLLSLCGVKIFKRRAKNEEMQRGNMPEAGNLSQPESNFAVWFCWATFAIGLIVLTISLVAEIKYSPRSAGQNTPVPASIAAKLDKVESSQAELKAILLNQTISERAAGTTNQPLVCVIGKSETSTTGDFYSGVGVALVGFILTGIITYFLKRSRFRNTLIQDIKGVVENYGKFRGSLKGVTAAPVNLNDLNLSFIWNDGRENPVNLSEGYLYLTRKENERVSSFYGALGRYGESSDKYNELLTQLLAISSADLKNHSYLLEGMKAAYNDTVKVCDEIVMTGREALNILL
jgi:hypothetical protein